MPKNVIQIELDTTGDVSGVRLVGKEFEKLEDKSEKTAKGISRNFEGSFRAMQRGGAVAFAAITAAIGLSVKAASDFQYGMAKVSTMFAGPATAALGKYEARLKALATIPTTENIRGMQDALYQILSAGVDAANAMDILELSLKAAAGGFTTTEIAADTITSVINAYNMSIEEATRVSDILFMAQMKGKTTFGEMGMALGRVLGTAAAAGIKFEEVAAAVATLTAKGIPTTHAITALNMAIITFIKPTKQATDLLKEYGVEIDSTRMREIGFIQYLNEVTSALGNNIDSIAQATGSVEGLKAIVNLTGPAFESAITNLNDITAAIESTEYGYRKMADTFQLKLNALKNALSIARTEIGEAFLPKITELITGVTEAAKGFADFAEEHPALLMNMGKLGAAAAIAAVGVGTMGLALPKVAEGIKMVNRALIASPLVMKLLVPLAALIVIYKDLADAINEPARRQQWLDTVTKEYGITLGQALEAQEAFTDAMTGKFDEEKWNRFTNIVTKNLEAGQQEMWAFMNALEALRTAPAFIYKPFEIVAPKPPEAPEVPAVAPSPAVTFGVEFAAGATARAMAERNMAIADANAEAQDLHMGYLNTMLALTEENVYSMGEVWQLYGEQAREEQASLEAAWATGLSTITDLHMKGSDRWKAISKSFADTAIRDIGRQIWARILGERAKQIAIAQGLAVEQTAAAASQQSAKATTLAWLGTAAAKITAFFGFLGPFAPIATAGVIAATIAMIKAIAFHKGGPVKYQVGGLVEPGGNILALLEEGEYVVRREAVTPNLELLETVNREGIVPNLELLEAIHAASVPGTASASAPIGGAVPAGAASSIFAEPSGGDTYVFNLPPDELKEATVDWLRAEVLPIHTKEQTRRRMTRP